MADAPSDLGTGAIYGGIGAVVAAILPVVLRYLGSRAAAHDAANAAHVASLKETYASEKATLEATINEFRSEISAIRRDNSEYRERLGGLTARLEIMERQNTDLAASNERLRIELSAATADVTMTRAELSKARETIDEQLQDITVLSTKLKDNGLL